MRALIASALLSATAAFAQDAPAPKINLSGTYEELWTRLKAQYGETMPRTLNLVTGPSRSGDIEQTILMGAHGPKRLHVIVVDET